MSRPRPARLPKTLAPHKVLRSLPGSLQPVLKARDVELGKEEINTRFKRFSKRVGALSRAVLDLTNAVQQESALNIAKACSSFVLKAREVELLLISFEYCSLRSQTFYPNASIN